MKHKMPKSNLKGISASMLIVSLFIGSAVLRIIAGANGALAQSDTNHDGPALPEPSAFSHVTDTNMDDERARLAVLHEALQERDAFLKEKEAEFLERQKTIDLATERLQTDLQRLQQAEAELRKTLAVAEGAAEGDLSRLTTVYENMKPKDAAAVFEAMAPDFAAGFLARMRPDAAAKVMAGLSPDFAYSISVILAGRNADVPKG